MIFPSFSKYDNRRISTLLAMLLLSSLLPACSATKDPNQPKSIIDKPTGAEEEQLLTAMDSYDRAIYTIAETQWTQFRDAFPASPYIPLAEIKIADSQFLRGEYQAAVISYEEFKRLHPGHEAVPYTVFQVGNAHLEQYEGVRRDQAPLQNAIRSYESLLASFPASEYAILARRSLSRCRELLAEHEAYVAEFYEARGDTKAAEVRRNTLLTLYPDSRVAGELRPEAERPAGAPSGKNRAQLVLTTPALITGLPAQPKQDRTFKTSTGDSIALPKIETITSRKPAVMGVECGTSDNAPIFILYTRYPLVSEGITDDSKLELEFDSSGLSDPEDITGASEGFGMSCDSEGSSVSVESTDRAARIHFSGLERGNLQLMKLTRPSRVIIATKK